MRQAQGYMQQLVKYIKLNISKGYTIEALKWALISQGHSKSEVSKAIELANKELASSAPILKEKPVIKIEAMPPVEPEKSFFSKIKNWFS